MDALKEKQHDKNEIAYRQALVEADKIHDPQCQENVRRAIHDFFEVIRKRIERGIYKDEK